MNHFTKKRTKHSSSSFLKDDKKEAAPETQNKTAESLSFAGVHISGPNSAKTSIVILKGTPLEKPLIIKELYEKIGSIGKLFSDERIVDIFLAEGPFQSVLVDCPLTSPPCVDCQALECPGVMKCEQVDVAYMLSLSERIKRAGPKKKRPINPQSQRICDVVKHFEEGNPLKGDGTVERGQQFAFEPSYSANIAPLVIRARTLQKRLNSLNPKIELGETSLPWSLAAICQHLGLPAEYCLKYRSFEHGLASRKKIFSELVKIEWIDNHLLLNTKDKILHSLENFQAFITSLIAALDYRGLSQNVALKNFLDVKDNVIVPLFSQTKAERQDFNIN